MLSTRQYKILRYLIDKNPVPISTISRIIAVSPRTISTELEVLAHYLGSRGATLCRKRGVGVWIACESDDVLNELRRALLAPVSESLEGLDLVLKYLSDQSWTTIEELAEKCFMSRSVAQHRLLTLRHLVEPFGLTLISQRGRGISLTGSETAWRRVLHRVLMDPSFLQTQREYGGPSLMLLRQQMDLLMPGFPLYRVIDVVRNYEEAKAKSLNEHDFVSIVAYLSLSVARARQGHQIVEAGASTMPGLSDEAQLLFSELSTEFGVDIAQFRADTAQLHYVLTLLDEGFDHTPSHQLVSQFVDNAITGLEKFLEVSFHHDTLLKNSLRLHLASRDLNANGSFLSRAPRPNPVLAQIKQEYPQIYFGLREVAEVFRDNWGITLSADELGYLTLHFGAALVRQARTLMAMYISGDPQSMIDMAITKIQREFPGLQIRHMAPHRAMTEANWTSWDVAILSKDTPIKLPASTPQVYVESWITDEDIRHCHRVINRILQKGTEQTISINPVDVTVSRILSSTIWTLQLSASDPFDVINRLGYSLITHYHLPEVFIQQVMDRERLGFSSVSDGFAFPHAIVPTLNPHQILMSVGTLTYPIRWGDVSVDIIAVLALSPDAGSLFMRLYKWFQSAAPDLRTATAVTMENQTFKQKEDAP